MPRRQCIEIWSLQHGPKIATFVAPRNGALFQFNYNLMGVMNNFKPKKTCNSCIFLDPSDKSLKEIVIPFHCANVNDVNSKAAKDLHLYRRLKLCLRNCDGNETCEEVKTDVALICNEIETNEMVHQVIEMLVNHKKITPHVFKIALEEMFEKLNSSDDIDQVENLDSLDLKSHLRDLVKIQCRNHLKLTNFFLRVSGLDDISEINLNENMKVIEKENIRLSNMELETVQKLIDLATLGNNSVSTSNSNNLKVTFGEKTKACNTFYEYLSVFFPSNADQILLKTDRIQSFGSVGAIIFMRYLEKGAPCKNLAHFMTETSIEAEDLMKLFLHYWAEKSFNYHSTDELINDMSRFYEVLKQICIYAKHHVTYEYNSICIWWQNVREYLLNSSCALRGLLAALICRNQALKYQGKLLEDKLEGESNFEEVSQEACQWTLLISKLDDIAVLGAILWYTQLLYTIHTSKKKIILINI